MIREVITHYRPVRRFPFSQRAALASNQTEMSLGMARDQIVFNMGERTGNIWMAEWKER